MKKTLIELLQEKKYQNKESRENAVIDFASFVKQEEYKISPDINLDALENVSFSVDNSSK